MLRIASAAYALCAALLLSIGLFGSSPAEAGGYYGERYGYHSHHRYRSTYYGRPYRSHYRPYYSSYRPHYRSFYSSYRPHYRPYYSSYRSYDRPYYSSYRPYYRPHYRSYDTGYYAPSYRPRYYDGGYRTASYYDRGYSAYGCQRRTVYMPYGWTWYRARDTRCW